MTSGTFLAIGVIGLIVLIISAFLDSDEADVDSDFDLDVDTDVDVDIETSSDIDTGSASIAAGILAWFSLKALAVAAVGFGFVGWAATTNNSDGVVVWIAAIGTGCLLWAGAVLLLFPWLRKQQGDNLQSVATYQGLPAQVVVRIPIGGTGTVQFTEPSGAVVRRDARSVDREQEVLPGTKVVIVMSTAEHVLVDEFTLLEDT